MGSLATAVDVARRAIRAVGPRSDFAWLVTATVTLVTVAVLGTALARVRDLACITIVGVDATEDTAIMSTNIVHCCQLVSTS